MLGKIAFSDLLTSMPFGNNIVALTVKGATLKEAFENSAFAKSDEEKSGRFLQHAGKYELGVTKYPPHVKHCSLITEL